MKLYFIFDLFVESIDVCIMKCEQVEYYWPAEVIIVIIIIFFFFVLVMLDIFLSNYIIDAYILWCRKYFKANIYISYFKMSTSSNNLRWCSSFAIIKMSSQFHQTFIHFCFFFNVQMFGQIRIEYIKSQLNNSFKKLLRSLLLSLIHSFIIATQISDACRESTVINRYFFPPIPFYSFVYDRIKHKNQTDSYQNHTINQFFFSLIKIHHREKERERGVKRHWSPL
jgi:hypothetical protein